MLASAVVMRYWAVSPTPAAGGRSWPGSLALFLAGSAASGAASSMQALIFLFRVDSGRGRGGLIVRPRPCWATLRAGRAARVQGGPRRPWHAAGAAGPWSEP